MKSVMLRVDGDDVGADDEDDGHTKMLCET